MNKPYMQSMTGKIRQTLAEPHTGELLFFLGYMIYLGKFVWASTMFPFPDIVNKLCLILSIVLIGLKIILYDKYDLSTLLKVGAIIVCSIMIFISTRYTNAMFWIFLVMGAKNINFRKLLKVYFVVTSTIVFLAVCSSIVGVIENLQYSTATRGIRNSFGIIYVTDFAAYVFFLFLAFFYLKGSELKLIHFAVAILACGLVYYFCNARVDCICILLIIFIFGVQTFFNSIKYNFRRLKSLWFLLWDKFGAFVMPFFALLSIIVTYCYSSENTVLNAMDIVFSHRLSLGKQGFDNYNITLFGQQVNMNGMGGSTILPDDYFFIDCSYVNILLRQGIIFLIILIAAYIIVCYKNKNDIYFLFAIALVAVNCVIAHHIIEVSYNPFAYALLTGNVFTEFKEKHRIC